MSRETLLPVSQFYLRDATIFGFTVIDVTVDELAAYAGEEPRRRIAPKAIARFKEKIRELTCRTRGISPQEMVKQVTTYLRGWLGYFGVCQTPSVLQGLEQ